MVIETWPDSLKGVKASIALGTHDDAGLAAQSVSLLDSSLRYSREIAVEPIQPVRVMSSPCHGSPFASVAWA